MKPTVGRAVHYQAFGTPGGEYASLPRAATVTVTQAEDPKIADEMTVGLMIANPTGLFFNQAVPYSEAPKAGHWNWPPRV